MKPITVYCPRCGQQQVWRNAASPGDYALGEEHICTACAHRFYLPNGTEPIGTDIDKQRLIALCQPPTEKP